MKPGQEIDEWIEQLFEICNDAVYIHPLNNGIAGNFIEVNDIACAQLGYTREELLHLSPEDIIAKSTYEVKDHVLKILSDSGHIVFEIVLVGKSGNIIPVEISSRVHHINGQNYVFSIARDISDRKRIENELRRSQSFLETIFENSPFSMWVSDDKGVMLRMNQACRELLHVTDEELVGKYIVLEDEIVKQQGLMHLVERVFEKGEKVQFPLEYDCSYLHKEPAPDSPQVILEVTISPVLNAQKQVIHAIIQHRDITERRRAENALREAEQKYRLIVDNSQSIIYTVGVDGTMTFVSPSWKTLLGHEYEEVAGHNFRLFVHKEDIPIFEEFLQRTAETRTVHPGVEYRAFHKDGSIHWYRSVITPVFDEHQNLTLFVGNAVDITERKRAEMALEKRMIALVRPLDSPEGITFEDLFNLDDLQRLQDEFSQATGVASIITDTDGTPITKPSSFCRLCSNILRTNEASRSRCTYSDSLLGRDCVDGPCIRPCLGAGLWGAGAGISVGGRHIANWLIGQVRGETQTEDQMRTYAREVGLDEEVVLEAFWEVPVMSYHQFENVAKALFTLASQLSAYAYQNVQQARFITEHRQAEEELRKLAAVVQHSMELVNLATPDGRMIFLNEAGRQMLGIKSEAIDNFIIFEVFPDRYKDIVQKELLPTLMNKGSWQGELQFRNLQTGELIDVFTTAIAVRDPTTGAVQFLANISLDITERKRAEKEHAKLTEQLNQAQKMESVGRLAGGVAHDFNNMLGVILGHTEIALNHVDAAQPIFTDLKEIQKAAERSADLTRQLLAFARKQTAIPRILNLNETVEGMLKMLRRLIGEDIGLTWRPGRNMGTIKMDPTQIDQILANLCINARDAIGDTGQVTIETGAASFDEVYCAMHMGYIPGSYIQLTVRDNGCGMSPETLSHLFEPFFTTKSLGKGTGLGLATVYGIIKQNNGFIIVNSELGKGSTFTVYLPQYTAQVAPTPKDIVPVTTESGHGTILLVEDESMILDITTTLLERLGYTVLAAATPGDAISMAETYTGEINLLVTDVIMPGMNGRDLANKLQSIYPNLKRLFMSGYTADIIAHHGVLDEDMHFIQKPFNMSDLTTKVREALSLSRDPQV